MKELTENQIAKIAHEYIVTPIDYNDYKIFEAALNRYKTEETKGNWGAIETEIKRQRELRRQRSYRKLSDYDMRAELRKSILIKLSAKFREIYPYKTGSARWAGGSNNFDVKILKTDEPSLIIDSYREWSRNGKWSGNSYTYDLSISASMRFEVIGNLLTVWKIGDKQKVWWFEQARGMDVNLKSGWLYKGYHVQAKDFEAAIKKVNKIRHNAAIELFKKRLNRRSVESFDLKKVWVTVGDSVKAGNCPTGTKNFKQRVQEFLGSGDIGAIRGDFLLSMIEKFDSEIYVKRAIKFAAVRAY